HNLLVIVDGASARAGTPSNEENALNPGELSVDRVLTDVLTIARRIGAKRMVIDSIPAMAFQMESEHAIRKAILRMDQILSRSGMTSIITTELPEQSMKEGTLYFSKYGVEEYVADGVILLSSINLGNQVARTIYIRKMRGTKHDMNIHPVEIGETGLTVKKIGSLG
ncbi:MAG: ATPase domain-containing protein, partial [Candidatus Omnitrophota bacterium]